MNKNWIKLKSKRTTSSGYPDFDDNSIDSDPAYYTSGYTCMVSAALLRFCNIFASLYVSPNRSIPSKPVILADDPKTFDIISCNDYATKSGIFS